ncbi:hypothetical protein NUM3379_27550 [Kineococcus sp. NUM-3379]
MVTSGRGAPVVVVSMTGLDAYQDALLHGVVTALAGEDVSVVAHVNHCNRTAVDPVLVGLLSRPSTGAVISTNSPTEEIEDVLSRVIAERGLPVVRIGQDTRGQSCVRADNVQGMRELVRHLLDDCGVRRPVLVRGLPHLVDHREREEVLRAELAVRGLRLEESLVLEGRSERDVARREMTRLLAVRRDLDAVVTMDDWSATAVVEALTDAGVRVPEDVVVTGFDNYPVGMIGWPALTTVDQDLGGQGAVAAREVLRLLAGGRPGRHVTTPCHLVVRRSTARGRGARLSPPVSAEQVARAAQRHLSTQSQLLALSRALTDCRTRQDICRVLEEYLPVLGFRRWYFVVVDAVDGVVDGAVDGAVGAHGSRRVLLGHRDRSDDGPGGGEAPVRFSGPALLPPGVGDGPGGFLAYEPLLGSGGLLGYLLFEHAHSPAVFVETLTINLSRALDIVCSTAQLAAHSQHLEALVAERTRELELEVAQRREAELELRRTNLELERFVLRDGLTGIANRTALEQQLPACWGEATERARPLALLMVDVDHFKSYNDRYGHLRGDAALRIVARCLQEALLYPSDLACRFGGEEFCALLPASDSEAALTVARRFTGRLRAAAVPHGGSSSGILTASVGVAAVVPARGGDPETLIALADHALYEAKRAGRDRITVRAGVPGDGTAAVAGTQGVTGSS